MSSFDPPNGGYQRPPGWYEPGQQPPQQQQYPPFQPPPPPGGGGYGGDPWDEEAGRDGPPWEQREEIGAVKALFQTLWEVLLHPGETFATAKRSGGLGNPLLYALLAGVIMMFFACIVGLGTFVLRGGTLTDATWVKDSGLPSAQAAEFQQYLSAMEANLPMMAALLLVALLTVFPLIIAMQLFLSSAFTHVGLMIFGGARRDFETTFRVIAYIYPTSVMLGAIPVIGGIGVIWSVIAKILALKEMHDTDTWRVVFAVLLPFILCCGCLFAGLAVMIGAGSQAGVAGP